MNFQHAAMNASAGAHVACTGKNEYSRYGRTADVYGDRTSDRRQIFIARARLLEPECSDPVSRLHTWAGLQNPKLKTMLAGGSDHYAVRLALRGPKSRHGGDRFDVLISKRRLPAVVGADVSLPEDSDMANAIGAMTSDIIVNLNSAHHVEPV